LVGKKEEGETAKERPVGEAGIMEGGEKRERVESTEGMHWEGG